MAFGRKQQDASAATGLPVPQEEGQPIWEAAVLARDAGRRIFSCAVTVAYSAGSGVGAGGKKTTTIRRWDASTLIEAIEDLGWRLEHLDHVWQQTEHNTAGGLGIIKGLTAAHMQFRRAG